MLLSLTFLTEHVIVETMSQLISLRLRCSAGISPSSWTVLRLWLRAGNKDLFLYICVTILAAFPDFLLSNAQTFLTDSLGMSSTTAASIINLQDGTAGICAIGGAIILDRYLSPYGLIISASAFCSLGLALVTGGCYHRNTGGEINSVRLLVAIGLFLRATGKLSLINTARALSGLRGRVLSGVNFGPTIILSLGYTLLSFTSTEDEELAADDDNKPDDYLDFTPFLIATVLLLLVTFISLLYLKVETFLKPIENRNSPIRDVARVYWAALKKRTVAHPPNSDNLYSGQSDSEHNSEHTVLLDHTDCKRFLDKAAVVENPPFSAEERGKGWLCTVSEVETSKRCLEMVPICMTFIAYGMIKSIGDTFFLDQGNQMDTTVGKGNREFPLQVFILLADLINAATIFLYKLIISAKLTGVGEKYTPAIEYAIGMVLSTLCCTSASWTAMELYEQHKVTKRRISVFWLTPQFVAFGAMDGLAEHGIENFYSEQLPPSLKGYALVFSQGMVGAGNVFATGLVAVTNAASHGNWFHDKNEDIDRLDRFYHLLTMIGVFIFLCYTVFAVRYKYHNDLGEIPGDVENPMRSVRFRDGAQESQNPGDREIAVESEELHDMDQENHSSLDTENATTSIQLHDNAQEIEPSPEERTLTQRRGYRKLKTFHL